MAMADLLTGANSDPFAVIGQDTSSQRAQIAQYSIMQAANNMQNNQYDQAIGAFKRALALDPQNTTAYNYMGKIYLSQGKNSDAIKAFQQLVRIQSNPSTVDSSSNAPTIVDAHVSLGNAYLQDKQYSSSEKEFKTASRLDPQNPLPPYTLGLQYANTDRLSEAETQFLNVQKIAPKDGNVYYALGMVYNKQGRYEEAAASLEKSQTLKNNFPAANYELGVAYDALGRTEDAQNQLSILQNSDPIQAQNLQALLNKPQISYIDQSNNRNFNQLLGPITPLWMLEDPKWMKPTGPSLSSPDGIMQISVAIQFNNKMDTASVMNPSNWEISRANNAEGGYYIPDNTGREVSIPKLPSFVSYNPETNQASVIFNVKQNSATDIFNKGATIDPSHLVFKFSGKDAAGRQMDTLADQIDGAALKAF
jgi:tetratricopeptide (TPR) repeat protein